MKPIFEYINIDSIFCLNKLFHFIYKKRKLICKDSNNDAIIEYITNVS